MLELKNLTKVYCTKNGSPIKALDNVNVTFPETGMIFLLGRSGSGKSTLLNLIGGLDKPTEGIISLRGKSSDTFSQQDFDSYRNTYVGFVFQEYNVFNEFNVEDNISLALELQKKPNDIYAVNALLNRVGLKGYNYRKPNTLSGGEKQRLAIARALIKNPQIILADEPTGALDSNTGRDVLDTLKELSEHKLVIVVSHDREYATKYGDRIIELKDGKVIKDVTKEYAEPEKINDKVTLVNQETIIINDPQNITKKELEDVVTILKNSSEQVIISTGEQNVKRIKLQSQITEDGKSQIFKDSNYQDEKEYDPTNVKFIRSKLPVKRAIKMGASSLRVKPFRLILTILLSVISFVLFGVSSTCMMYDKNYSIHDALKSSYNEAERITKSYFQTYTYYYIDYDDGGSKTLDETGTYEEGTVFGVAELAELNNKYPNLDFAGIYNFEMNMSSWYSPEFDLNYGIMNDENDKTMHPIHSLIGFSDCGKEYMDRNFELVAGTYPKNKTEIAISSYVYELYKCGSTITTSNPIDFIGKEIEVEGYYGDEYKTVTLTVSGIYKVFDLPEDFNELTNEDTKLKESDLRNLKSSLSEYLSESFALIGFVSDDFYDEHKGDIKPEYDYYYRYEDPNGLDISNAEITDNVDKYETYCYLLTNELLFEGTKYIDINGNEIEYSLNDNEVMLSKDTYYIIIRDLCSELSSYYKTLVNNNLFEINGSPYLVNNQVYQASKETSQIYKAAKNLEDVSYKEIFNSSLSSDINTIINFLNENYINTMTKSLLLTKALELVDSLEDPTSLETLVNAYAANPDTDNYNALLSSVQSYLVSSENESLLYKAEILYNESLIPRDKTELYTKVLDETATPDEINEFKEFVNQKYKEMFSSLTSVEKEIDYIFNGFEIDFSLFTLNTTKNIPRVFYKSYTGDSGELTVKGFYLNDYQTGYLVTKNFIDTYGDYSGYRWELEVTCNYVIPEDAKYQFLISFTDYSKEAVDVLNYECETYKYTMTNSAFTYIELVVELIELLSTVFVGVAAVVGVFASLLLANFISVSINNKKKDIGILRAVGARKYDVYKIFLSESLIITSISVIISIASSIITVNYINEEVSSMIGMKLLSFGILNGLFIAAIAIFVAVVSTLIPVIIHSKKPPVEAIREL